MERRQPGDELGPQSRLRNANDLSQAGVGRRAWSLGVCSLEFRVWGLGVWFRISGLDNSHQGQESEASGTLPAAAMPALHSRYWQRIYTGVEGKARCGECWVRVLCCCSCPAQQRYQQFAHVAGQYHGPKAHPCEPSV